MPKQGKKAKTKSKEQQNNSEERGIVISPGPLDDAFTALREAQRSIDTLRHAKEEAAKEVYQANEAVKEAEKGKSGEKSYGEEKYWENRYQKDIANSGSVLVKDVLYEWYLPYSDIRSLLMPELVRYGGVGIARILVPGCGNSSLCEDMMKDGAFQCINYILLI